MSFVLRALGGPSAKISIGIIYFVLYVLPPVVCYFAVAVLAITPQTHTTRVALWPLTALLALRAVVSVDTSHEKPEHQISDINLMALVISMFLIATRTLGWTLTKEPFVRHFRPANSPPSIIMDAIDLTLNFRGHGWNWSHGLYIPHETRPTNRTAFVFHAFFSAVIHALILGILHRAILTSVSVEVGAISGGSTIFDDTLPFPLRYLRSSLISACAAFAIYAMIQMGYDLATVLAVLFFGQDPAQWPPIFDAPWYATSLSEFWGRKWHQCHRQHFLVLGGYPLSVVFGRAGMVIGAFLASGIFHHIVLLTLDSRIELRWMLTGFGMMGPGLLAERAFRQLTGRWVGGIVGWIWTMTWLLLWGNVIVEGSAKARFVGYGSLIDGVPSLGVLVDRLVISFDAWLHTFG
ncbi:hypothetical protein JVU11DRAFT_1018 [Chiua virens]|nr:hypothetical protein JVU11DRAFT_1018 [Chiua virens]